MFVNRTGPYDATKQAITRDWKTAFTSVRGSRAATNQGHSARCRVAWPRKRRTKARQSACKPFTVLMWVEGLGAMRQHHGVVQARGLGVGFQYKRAVGEERGVWADAPGHGGRDVASSGTIEHHQIRLCPAWGEAQERYAPSPVPAGSDLGFCPWKARDATSVRMMAHPILNLSGSPAGRLCSSPSPPPPPAPAGPGWVSRKAPGGTSTRWWCDQHPGAWLSAGTRRRTAPACLPPRSATARAGGRVSAACRYGQ